jgi:hypothetical protein
VTERREYEQNRPRNGVNCEKVSRERERERERGGGEVVLDAGLCCSIESFGQEAK